jgi:hypothetical protein
MLITLDPALQPETRSIEYSKGKGYENFISGFSDAKYDYQSKKTTQTLFPVDDNILGDYYHQNYLSYLARCWSMHLGAILTPDIIWYSLLCEITSIVAADPEKFRHLFTDSAEKKDISIDNGGSHVLPMDEVMKRLETLVPAELAKDLMGDFSTSTRRSKLAQYAAFADLVSPYYNYFTFACGIPSVDLRGTKEDWQDVARRWTLARDKGLVEGQYAETVQGVIGDIVANSDTPDPEFFKTMFTAQRCGSGGEIAVNGWFTKFLRVQPEGIRKPENFASHVAIVNYHNLSNKKDYVMKSGILSSRIKDEFLEPEFGRIIFEKSSEVATEGPEITVVSETIIPKSNKLKPGFKVEFD